jgi:hypothetical protein
MEFDRKMIDTLNKIFIGLSSFINKGFDTILSVPKILLMSRFGLKFPNSQSNNACVLGNGPSLNESLSESVTFIRNTEIYCVNNFATSESFTLLQPQNYVLLDPAYFLYSVENNSRVDVQNTIDFLIKKVDWRMNLFIPVLARKSYLVSEILRQNKNISIHYYNYTILRGFDFFRFFGFRTRLGMPQCQNILAASLYIAITRKYENIYIFGADHSWHEELRLDESGELYGRQFHFYDKPESVQREKNESSKKIYTQFQSLVKAFYSYEVLCEYSKNRQVKVWNASKKSYIDSFEKTKV